MPLYGIKDVAVTYTPDGGSPVSIEGFVLNGLTAKKIARMMEATPLGAAWEEHLPTGEQAQEPIKLAGKANLGGEPHATLSVTDTDPNATPGVLAITWGGSVQWSTSVWREDYQLQVQSKSVHRFEATLRTTGALTES